MPPRKSTPAKKKRLCDDLWRKLIVSRRVCERCGDTYGQFEAAHIVRRRFSHTRTDETNGWCLCHECHGRVDGVASNFMHLVDKTIGPEKLHELEQKSLDRSKKDWFAEHERLKALVRSSAASQES